MRKIILALFVCMMLLTTSVFGQTAQEATPSPTSEGKEAQTLKEKLAAKVAELRKKDQKAVSGVITETGKDTVKVRTDDSIIYTIKVDDLLTKIYQIAGAQKKELNLSDLEKGAYIIATGPLSDRTVSANYIYQDEQFLVGAGKITEVNKTDFYIKVLTTEKDTVTLDIESLTKKLLLDIKSLETETIGFTKVKEGDTVHFVVKKTGTELTKNRYSVQAILIIPQEYFLK